MPDVHSDVVSVPKRSSRSKSVILPKARSLPAATDKIRTARKIFGRFLTLRARSQAKVNKLRDSIHEIEEAELKETRPYLTELAALLGGDLQPFIESHWDELSSGNQRVPIRGGHEVRKYETRGSVIIDNEGAFIAEMEKKGHTDKFVIVTKEPNRTALQQSRDLVESFKSVRIGGTTRLEIRFADIAEQLRTVFGKNNWTFGKERKWEPVTITEEKKKSK
jgi:hypothetical protein